MSIVLSSLVLIAIVVAAWLARSVYDYFFSAHGNFWRTVGKNPELSLMFFSKENDCLIDPPFKPKGFAGPFRVMDRTGRAWKIYILFDRIDEIQARIAQNIREHIATR